MRQERNRENLFSTNHLSLLDHVLLYELLPVMRVSTFHTPCHR